jgi:hypothetical protein
MSPDFNTPWFYVPWIITNVLLTIGGVAWVLTK